MKDIFELIKVYHFDIAVNGESEKLRGRVELLRNLQDSKRFRLTTAVIDAFRLQPSFPDDSGEDSIETCDEFLWTETSIGPVVKSQEDFTAGDEISAADYVLKKIDRIHDHLIL